MSVLKNTQICPPTTENSLKKTTLCKSWIFFSKMNNNCDNEINTKHAFRRYNLSLSIFYPTFVIWIELFLNVWSWYIFIREPDCYKFFIMSAPYLAGVLGVPEHPRNLGVQKGAKPDFCLSEFSYYYEHPRI